MLPHLFLFFFAQSLRFFCLQAGNRSFPIAQGSTLSVSFYKITFRLHETIEHFLFRSGFIAGTAQIQQPRH